MLGATAKGLGEFEVVAAGCAVEELGDDGEFGEPATRRSPRL